MSKPSPSTIESLQERLKIQRDLEQKAQKTLAENKSAQERAEAIILRDGAGIVIADINRQIKEIEEAFQAAKKAAQHARQRTVSEQLEEEKRFQEEKRLREEDRRKIARGEALQPRARTVSFNEELTRVSQDFAQRSSSPTKPAGSQVGPSHFDLTK